MFIKEKDQLEGAGAFNKKYRNYSRLDNLLISLVVWRLIPLKVACWVLSRGEK